MVHMWDAREETGQPKQLRDTIRSTRNLTTLVGLILARYIVVLTYQRQVYRRPRRYPPGYMSRGTDQ